ncbi:AraC family transcriptional regulator [Aquimarina sp. AD10]|uniref:helix-turn-helix domain-containing protein n=1 Tax=Aquimarina TaxID=290174 RepID=UPI000E4B9BB8|nr:MULTISPECIES: AraC family transcriptional regulator [Aquimarina]AXT59317.1 AraC family transcriptional regulator [Aquimarina sp. AD10]RKM95176.1 helix-turn-helix domain-containing protein [Aquimarina sp. AD10]
MKIVKPSLEKIVPEFGSSLYYERFSKENKNKNPIWHYHPEIEIVYVNGGTGKRQIGSHMSYYRKGALMLIGSNLPHCGFTDHTTGNSSETIIQMLPDFLGSTFFDVPEMNAIGQLLEQAKKGIVYHGDTKRRIGAQIEALKDLESFEKLLGFLEVLREMQKTNDYTILNAEGFIVETSLQDNNRINLIFNFVQQEFSRPISLDEIADKVSMSVPGFCRYFKKITGKTFTQFVNEYRLVHAAKLLHEKQTSITDICYESGFSNFSHFSKLFKQFTGKTPSMYRTELNYVIS